MSALEIIEHLVFWTVVITIAFLGRDSPEMMFTILFYLIIYYLVRYLLKGGSVILSFFSINLLILVFLFIYFSTGATPLTILKNIGRGLSTGAKYLMGKN